MHITRNVIQTDSFLARPPARDCGASACFFGIVRNHHEGRAVIRLYYDCYEALAEKELARIAHEVCEKYGCSEVRVLHRFGMIEVGEIAVAIEASSAHRDESFKACREAIERIKYTVPIWKQEFYQDGTSNWVLCKHGHEIKV
jgi:molybdopterin synthase catalytic subunit